MSLSGPAAGRVYVIPAEAGSENQRASAIYVEGGANAAVRAADRVA
jgi:hypothetical protein